MPDLEAVRAQSEAAEEGCGAEAAGGDERLGRLEYQAALGDQAGGVSLRSDIIGQRERGRPKLDLKPEIRMPSAAGSRSHRPAHRRRARTLRPPSWLAHQTEPGALQAGHPETGESGRDHRSPVVAFWRKNDTLPVWR